MLWIHGLLEVLKNNNKLLFTKKISTIYRYITPTCFNRFSPHSIEVRDDDLIFHFFPFFTMNLLKIFKLETSHIDRSPVMCSLFRPTNSLDSIWILLVKAYLSRSSNLNFKYLGFDCQVKLNFSLTALLSIISSIPVHVH